MSQRAKKKRLKLKSKPIWEGPESPNQQGGITQSLLSGFLVCKERFRINVIEGWSTPESWSVPLEFGQMWHECEEHFSRHKDWEEALKVYAQKCLKRYPNQKDQINCWYSVCKRQFPIYIKHWKNHPDVKKRTPLLQEVSFKIPYKLPSGTVVYLRGKFDSVDVIGNGRQAGIYLQENKTIQRIDQEKICRRLTFDMQTMIYLIALKEYQRFLQEGSDQLYHPNYASLPGEILNSLAVTRIKGVRYNVIRRAGQIKRGGRMVNAKGHDGKPIKNPDGTTQKVRQGEESNLDFAKRVETDILDDPKNYFHRWKVEISDADIQNFKDQFLDPCLEELAVWYWLVSETKLPNPVAPVRHYRLPYGVYNSVTEGRFDDVDEYMTSGSTAGLQKIKTLFPELEN